MVAKYYTEDDIRSIIKTIKKYFEENNIAGCDFRLPDLKPIEVSVIAFRHSEERIVLEVTEKHIDSKKELSELILSDEKKDKRIAEIKNSLSVYINDFEVKIRRKLYDDNKIIKVSKDFYNDYLTFINLIQKEIGLPNYEKPVYKGFNIEIE